MVLPAATVSSPLVHADEKLVEQKLQSSDQKDCTKTFRLWQVALILRECFTLF